MEVTKQTDGRWRYGSMVFTSEDDAKAYEAKWLQAKAERSDANIGQPPTGAKISALGAGAANWVLGGFLGICVLAFLFWAFNRQTPKAFTASEALVMCQMAFKKISRDPDNADIPVVKNFGDSKEAYFAWGGDTRVMHLRNGLGLDVAATGSCVVDMKSGKFTSITLNGESIL